MYIRQTQRLKIVSCCWSLNLYATGSPKKTEEEDAQKKLYAGIEKKQVAAGAAVENGRPGTSGATAAGRKRKSIAWSAAMALVARAVWQGWLSR